MVAFIKQWKWEPEAAIRKIVVAHTWTANHNAPWVHDTSRERETPFQKISPIARLNERMYRDSLKERASEPGAKGIICTVLENPERYRLEVVSTVVYN